MSEHNILGSILAGGQSKRMGKDKVFLEIDNKAINHRPDMFSHIWVAREIAVIENKKLPYTYETYKLDTYQKFPLKNTISDVVKRYMLPNASDSQQVLIGRVFVVVIVVLALLVAATAT